MNTEGRIATLKAERTAPPPFLARLVLGRFARVQQGTLALHEGGRRHEFGGGEGPRATLHVRDARFWGAVASGGTVGAGEAYAKGWWTSDDLTELVRLFVRNREALAGVEGGLARLTRPLRWLQHARNRNTRRGSRRNIAAHYDLSNAFFGLFLDDTMTYSSGIFERPEATLREASIAKIDAICRKLDLRPDDQLLEIGTGWGALAIHAAREYGCRVTTTTISARQHALAAERIRDAGLDGRVTLLLEDYRRLVGSYDKLVSVEMIESIGHQYFDEFFGRCAALLKPGGRMCLQSITIADQHYESALREVDYIQRHIFPGSCIPSVAALCASTARSSDLRLVHLEDIGLHYVRTLEEWRGNLRARWKDALALGLSEDFLRTWEFYFCYCAGGFAERHISNVHLVYERPGASASG